MLPPEGPSQSLVPICSLHEMLTCSLIGIGEIFLLPLDVLKIKRQTNPEAFRGRGLLKIVRDEGFALYRGWEWTAARNAPGSFAVPPLPAIIFPNLATSTSLYSISLPRFLYIYPTISLMKTVS